MQPKRVRYQGIARGSLEDLVSFRFLKTVAHREDLVAGQLLLPWDLELEENHTILERKLNEFRGMPG